MHYAIKVKELATSAVEMVQTNHLFSPAFSLGGSYEMGRNNSNK